MGITIGNIPASNQQAVASTNTYIATASFTIGTLPISGQTNTTGLRVEPVYLDIPANDDLTWNWTDAFTASSATPIITFLGGTTPTSDSSRLVNGLGNATVTFGQLYPSNGFLDFSFLGVTAPAVTITVAPSLP